MILAVNANAALDRVMFIDRFLPGQTMRPEITLDCIGGKSADAALVLSVLGAPHLLISFMAGDTGLLVEKLYQKFGICYELFWVPGETRISHVLVETDFNRHSHVTTRGYAVTAEDTEHFLGCVSTHLSAADWVITAGSLPEGAPDTLHRQVIEMAHKRGAMAMIDCAGKPLLQALAGRPEVVKLNRSEFHATFGTTPAGLADLARAAKQVLFDYDLNAIVVTLGAEGILAITSEAGCFAHGPKLAEVNAAGAGDAATAAIAYRLSLGDDWPDVLRWACASGAAVAITPGTGECAQEDIEKFFPQMLVEPIP